LVMDVCIFIGDECMYIPLRQWTLKIVVHTGALIHRDSLMWTPVVYEYAIHVK